MQTSDTLALPFGGGKTSPISAVDVARTVAVILDDPAPHIGQIYDLTGPESADLDHYARVFSEALGRPIRYRDVPLPAWSEGLRQAGFPEHVVSHLSAMTELNRHGRYDRITDAMYKLTGKAPTSEACALAAAAGAAGLHPTDDIHAPAAYRRQLAEALVRRALLSAASRARNTES